MVHRFGSALAAFALPLALTVATGCLETEVEGEMEGLEEGDPLLEEAESGGVIHGALLFNLARFDGNGRRCASCHPVAFGQSGTLHPLEIQFRFLFNPNGELFRHDGADVIGGNTFNRIRQHATILIDRALPDNVSIAGSSARSVILPRGIPTVMNTPALDSIFQYDGRAATLQIQAAGAIEGHAQSTDVTEEELDAIAEFQMILFNRQNLRNFVNHGTPLTMPPGRTASEQRGRRFFIDDGLNDMDSVGESFGSACGWCHSGNFLNTSSAFFGENIFPGGGFPEGINFNNAFVSEFNPLGNPVYDFELTNPDGTVTVLSSPDPGLMLTIPDPFFFNVFKVGTLWGAADTAPYFHDNSAKNLAELMEHYDLMLQIISEGMIDLSTQDKLDIIAYSKLL
jgi:cytochrome c peroxidase